MASDLESFRDHARTMAAALHRTECLTRTHPWTKLLPRPDCVGCVTPEDRALWAQLADEIDDHLAATSGDQPMLGDA